VLQSCACDSDSDLEKKQRMKRFFVLLLSNLKNDLNFGPESVQSVETGDRDPEPECQCAHLASRVVNQHPTSHQGYLVWILELRVYSQRLVPFEPKICRCSLASRSGT